MLELRLDESSGIYARPLQMKANNGIFHHRRLWAGSCDVAARSVENRWIVPLDRRRGLPDARYGVKFQIPFELMVVFSTNLEPSDLADEAFLRRIHNKIFVRRGGRKSFRPDFHPRGLAFQYSVRSRQRGILAESCVCAKAAPKLRACYSSADICNILTFYWEDTKAGPRLTIGANRNWNARRRCISQKG